MTHHTSSPSVVLITGATSGIGRQTALDFAARGFRVFATGRNRDALLELDACGHDTLTALRLDVTDNESIAAVRARVLEETDGHGVDILVNNAGYGDLGPTELISDADLRRQFDTNVFGLMSVTREFLPEMRERRSGRIINVSSIGGRVTMPMFGVYSASKYALEALSDALRMEMAAFGVRVALIEPGPINTNFTGRAMDNAEKYKTPTGPYASIIVRAEKMAELAEKTGVHPRVISRAIQRAATARWPRARYVAPLRGAVMMGMLRLMPTRLSDFVLRRIAGFSRKAIEGKAADQLAATN